MGQAAAHLGLVDFQNSNSAFLVVRITFYVYALVTQI